MISCAACTNGECPADRLAMTLDEIFSEYTVLADGSGVPEEAISELISRGHPGFDIGFDVDPVAGLIKRLNKAYDCSARFSEEDVREAMVLLKVKAAQIQRLHGLLEDVVCEFGRIDEHGRRGPGGIPVLECIFSDLAFDGPHIVNETNRCDEPGCRGRAVMRWPDNEGRERHTCETQMLW